jgi:hypothetical protein
MGCTYRSFNLKIRFDNFLKVVKSKWVRNDGYCREAILRVFNEYAQSFVFLFFSQYQLRL